MPIVWLGYVDDTFGSFMAKKKSNGSISFLDFKIPNVDGDLKFEIFRKPTTTKRTMPATLNHICAQKMAT